MLPSKKQTNKQKKRQNVFLSVKCRLLIAKGPLFWILRGGKYDLYVRKSWRKYDIYWLLKSSCFQIFGVDKHDLSLRQKVDGNMTFTGYWKVLVLNGKHDLFWDKKLMESWYLLITEKFLFRATEKFLFWTFRWWEIQPMTFQDLRNTFFRAV